MKASTDSLWSALDKFELDLPDVALTFSQRLARENGWSPSFAQRVVAEYKRFVFLSARAGHPVTPSDEVDQAWHLHLAYTRSYWEEMCGGILGQALHHGPTKGGAAEDAKFHDWYGRTKESYERFFGEVPPSEIWPSHEERFDPRRRFQRVDLGSVWMLSKVGWSRRARLAAVAASVVLASGLFLVSCDGTSGGNAVGWLVTLFIVVFGIVVISSNRGGRGKGGGNGNGCGGGYSCGTGGSGSGSSGKGHGSSGCGSDSGSSGCGSSGCGGGGCGGGGD